MSTGPRVLIVAYCFPPFAAIGTLRTMRLVKQLSAGGWHVQVLTGAQSSYAAGTPVDDGLLEAMPAGVEVVRAGAIRGWERLSLAVRPLKQWYLGRQAGPQGSVTQSMPPAGARRSFQELVERAFAIPDDDAGWFLPAVSRGIAAAVRSRPDVIYSSAPPWTGHLVAMTVASALGCPWVADFRDPWARGPWRGDRPEFAKRAAGMLEQRAVRRADALLFTTEALRNEVVGHYGPWLAPKCHVVRNGCEPEDFDGVVPEPNGECFTLAHLGSLYGARNPLPIFRAIAAALDSGAIDRRRFKLKLVGPVALGGVDLASSCRDLGLTDVVELVPRLNRREGLAAMLSSNALLLVQPGHPLSVPGKFYEYLFTSKPILAITDEGETAELVRATGSGMVVPIADERAIRDAVITLVQGRFVGAVQSPAAYDGRLRAIEMQAVLEEAANTRARSMPNRATFAIREEK